MSNRVEELESKVAELQAAVNGLTEELVETKERLRQLEDGSETDYPVTGPADDASADRSPADAGGESQDEGAKVDENVDENTEAESESESESDESDIIVA